MNFLKQIRDAIYNPKFYKQIPGQKLETGIVYFLKLIVLLAIVHALLLTFPIFIGITELTNKGLPKIISQYPENLQVKISSGKASTNVAEPYSYPLPPTDGAKTPKNLITIDTKTPYDPSQIKQYDSVILLKKDAVYFQSGKQGVRSYPLSNVKDLVLDRQSIGDFLNRVSPYFKFIAPVIILLVFVLFILGGLFRLIYLFFLAAVLFITSRIMNQNFTYTQSYKISLYAVTAGILADTLINLTFPLLHIYGFPFLSTIISAVVFILNFRSVEGAEKS